MVWLVWAYTAWVTNWPDPERLPVRALLLALASLWLSAAVAGAFVLIALGESVVVIGATLAHHRAVTPAAAAALVAAFVGCVALWWVYVDHSAEAGARALAASRDPGRLGRSASHAIHPVMIFGIILVAAAAERVLTRPSGGGGGALARLLLGGAAVFLAGHALVKATVFRVWPWSRVAAVGALVVLSSSRPTFPPGPSPPPRWWPASPPATGSRRRATPPAPPRRP